MAKNTIENFFEVFLASQIMSEVKDTKMVKNSGKFSLTNKTRIAAGAFVEAQLKRGILFGGLAAIPNKVLNNDKNFTDLMDMRLFQGGSNLLASLEIHNDGKNMNYNKNGLPQMIQ